MNNKIVRVLFSLLCSLTLAAALGVAGDETAGLKAGKAAIGSADALTFGPNGVLFVGDTRNASIWALKTPDAKAGKATKIEVGAINEKVAAMLGASAEDILINDLAVHPLSKRAYLAVARGRGPDSIAVLLAVDGQGKLEDISLDNIAHAKVALPGAPAADAKDGRGRPLRVDAITDIAYADGQVIVAGLSNEEFSSKLRAIPYPFATADNGASIEIYHGAHGRWETNSPVRTFVPYEIKSEPHLLAAYTCTPLVKFPMSELKPGAKVVGTTIAELGNRNRPLDMVVYNKGGKDYVLMSNSSRGVMKMSTESIDTYGAIKDKVEDKQGLPYETIAHLTGVEQLDKLDDMNALILARAESGALDLKTIALP